MLNITYMDRDIGFHPFADNGDLRWAVPVLDHERGVHQGTVSACVKRKYESFRLCALVPMNDKCPLRRIEISTDGVSICDVDRGRR